MAADLHIHILEGCDVYIVRRFSSSVLGSKYYDYVSYSEHSEHFLDDFRVVSDMPNIWVGEVSWLKAAVFDDPETYVPNVIAEINEKIGEDFPVLTEQFIEEVQAIFDVATNSTFYTVSDAERIIEFLKDHVGKRVFTVSW